MEENKNVEEVQQEKPIDNITKVNAPNLSLEAVNDENVIKVDLSKPVETPESETNEPVDTPVEEVTMEDITTEEPVTAPDEPISTTQVEPTAAEAVSYTHLTLPTKA